MFSLIAVATIIDSSPLAFAQSSHTILMPSGASDPEAPFFWSEQNTGATTGEITIFPKDSITWENADTALHTVTSVTPSGEIDGLFNSGLIDAGNSFSMSFSDIGDFYYFCIHPWMSGIVHVVQNPGMFNHFIMWDLDIVMTVLVLKSNMSWM